MRFLLRILFVFGLAIPPTVAVALYLALDGEPMVRRPRDHAGNIKRAKPYRSERAAPAQARAPVVTISQQDLDLVANYLAIFYPTAAPVDPDERQSGNDGQLTLRPKFR